VKWIAESLSTFRMNVACLTLLNYWRWSRTSKTVSM